MQYHIKLIYNFCFTRDSPFQFRRYVEVSSPGSNWIIDDLRKVFKWQLF